MKSQRCKLGKEAGRLFSLCFIAYMFSYFGRYDFSACQNAMMTEGIIDLASASLMSSAYFICYGAGQLINGAIGVRVSPKYMIACGRRRRGKCTDGHLPVARGARRDMGTQRHFQLHALVSDNTRLQRVAG